MKSFPEIVLNLWYVYDDVGAIYSLRAKAYQVNGTEEVKLLFLRNKALTDFEEAEQFPIPDRFHITVGGQRVPVFHCSALKALQPLQLFEDAIKEIEQGLSKHTNLRIGESPLFCITPLLYDEQTGVAPGIDGISINDQVVKTKPDRVLRGKTGELSIPGKQWSKILGLAQNWGWHPEQSRIAYLTRGAKVSTKDAANLSAAFQEVLKQAVKDPISVYPVDADMGLVSLAADFFAGGEFEVSQ